MNDWGFEQSVPMDDIYNRIVELEAKVQSLEDLVKVLEEENVSQSNALYECWNSLDARIDILTGEKWINNNV